MLTVRKSIAFVCCILWIGCGILVAGDPSLASPGQARTLLPDGRTLITGGLDPTGQPSSGITILNLDGSAQPLSIGMAFARAGHTATVLPNGKVLIFGGIGSDSHLVSALEYFDPITESLERIPTTLIPRAFHTATVLTNGQLAVIGGVTEGGIYTNLIQLWNYGAQAGITIPAHLLQPRIQQTATLLADGDVLIRGGRAVTGEIQPRDEIFDQVKLVSSFGSAPIQQNPVPFEVAESIPADNSSGVDISQLIALRFTVPAKITTLTTSNVFLNDATNNRIAIQVIAAESGRLAFFLPASPLQPGTNYSIFVTRVADVNGQVIPDTTIHFQTAGQSNDNAGELWIPGAEALSGNWNSQTGESSWQKLPSLRATAGVTALAGQVLRLNGLPLAGVTLSIGSSSTRSDSTGRFLLKNLKPGRQVLTIDGRTANRTNAEYGFFEVATNIVGGKTNALNYTIWMTRLDTEHAIVIPSPTTAPDTVLTTPLLPGLEFHLPANTVIVDHEGHPARRFTITPIPLDKPPFPLPLGVAVPIYFTIQPGGSYIDVRSVPNASAKGGRLVYPNTFHNHPGTAFNFWNYDAESRGWYIYGQGHVSADGNQILPDKGVVVYELTGAMVGGSGPDPSSGPNGPSSGDPVNLGTGLFVYNKTDLVLPDVISLQLQRTYRTNDTQQRPFGIGTTHNYDIFLTGDVDPYSYQELILADGGRVRFNRISPGTGYTDAIFENTEAATGFYGARISFNSAIDCWELRLRNGTILTFPDSYHQNNQDAQALIKITDRYNNVIRMQRDGNNRLTQVTSPNGRYIAFQYDSLGRVTSATDNSGRSVSYQYDANGNLWQVTDANGGVTTFTYDSNHNMLTITDPRQITYLTNWYDSNGRVYQQMQADGNLYQFSWTPSNYSFQQWQVVCPECGQGISFSRYSPLDSEGYMGLISAVDVTDPRGYVRHVQFDMYGNRISDTWPEQETYNYAVYGDNLLKSVTDALSRVTSFDYDPAGNTTVFTRSSNSGPVTRTFTYTSLFSRLQTATDPLQHTITIGYDGVGNATSITDPLGYQASASYFGNGQIQSATDPLGNEVTFGYVANDLATVTDPLGNTTTLAHDAVGRLASFMDALGNITKYQYDGLNDLLTFTDALGNQTGFGYDGNGNLTSVTDANGHINRYSYDTMDRVNGRTDPLSRSESYGYDPNGNLVSATDRKLQVSNYVYDAFNRLSSASFGVVNGVAQSSYSVTYDAGNRPYQIADSLTGTITLGFDLLDRLSGEATPEGSIGYTYDNANRRQTAQVAGQPLINYSWDADNRLMGISQGSNAVGFTYDVDYRRQTMTLPNGILASYGYDKDSNLLGITYSLGSNNIGNLAYSYDQLGRRLSVSGSLASAIVPQSITSATYDAANELTNWNGTSVGYDANGNTSEDGTHSYSWDARNQLASIDYGSTAGFIYDPLGRRVGKVVFGTSTAFLYDWVNPVQELSGTTPTANMLAGGIDEYFLRTDANGTVNYLADALGSTSALTDTTGTIRTQYAYEPFGATSVSGILSTSSYQYTGRENDGTGLYYYRARYYNPQIGRFIDEDPMGFRGGINLYAYVGNSPLNFFDPLGMDKKKPCAVNNGAPPAMAGPMNFPPGMNPNAPGTRPYRYPESSPGPKLWPPDPNAPSRVPSVGNDWPQPPNPPLPYLDLGLAKVLNSLFTVGRGAALAGVIFDAQATAAGCDDIICPNGQDPNAPSPPSNPEGPPPMTNPEADPWSNSHPGDASPCG